MCTSLALLALALWPAPALRAPRSQGEPIVVIEESGGCQLSSVAAREPKESPTKLWEAVPGGYLRSDRFLSDECIANLRALLCSRRSTPADLLARVGIDPAALARHRIEILCAAIFHESALQIPPELEAELQRRLTFEHLAPHILAEIQGHNWGSTSFVHFEVRLPGTPALTVSSRGLVPLMLPWQVELGEERWTVADPELSRVLLPLAEPQGSCARLLDGKPYWAADFWNDERFWERFLGEPILRAQALGDAAWWPGYLPLSERFEIRELASGRVDGERGSRLFELRTYGPGISWAHWRVPLDGERRALLDWNDFAALFSEAERVAARQPWLEEWRRSGLSRTVGLRASGKAGTAATDLQPRAQRAWEAAGFAGRPEYEIELLRDGLACGRVYLGEREPGALIESAQPAPPGARPHWFDALDFSLHPKSGAATYGRVADDGRLELRELADR